MDFEVIKNPDSEFVKNHKKKVKSNSGYCPSRLEKTPETKCPCKEFRENQECMCGLYVKIPVI